MINYFKELINKHKEEGISREDSINILEYIMSKKDIINDARGYNELLEMFIPNGMYCYNGKSVCPFYTPLEDGSVYCKYLDLYDFSQCSDEVWERLSEEDIDKSSFVLWDSVKECGIKEENIESSNT